MTMLRTSESGFTLLELLVSITLLAFLSLTLVSGLRFGTLIWNKSQTANLDTNAVRAAQTWVTHDLTRLYPKYVVVSPTDASVAFDGTAGRMTFLSATDATTGEMAQVTLEAVRDDNGIALQAEVLPDLATPRATSTTVVLLRHIKALEFAYYGANAQEKTPKWHQSWQHERSLPLLIRVRAAMPRASASWNELVVRPKIAADVSCIFDPITRFCQGRS